MHLPQALALSLHILTHLTLTTALPLPPFQNINTRQATDGYLTSARFSDPISAASHLHTALDSARAEARAEDSVTLPSYLSAPKPSRPSRLTRTPAKPALVHNTGGFSPDSPPPFPNVKPSRPQAQTLRQGGAAGVTGGAAGATSGTGRTGTPATGAAAGGTPHGGTGAAAGGTSHGETGDLGHANVVVGAASGAEVPGRSGPGGAGVAGVAKRNVVQRSDS